jgi:3-oxoacyl-[acyl-carrier protein] reductase
MSSAAPKIALITGATGGIGNATSLALAKEGYTLALHYNKASESTVNNLLASVSEVYEQASPPTISTPKAQAFQADLSDFEAIGRLHGEVVSTLGDPAVLFLNAGSTCGVSGTQSISDISLDVFEQTWRINTAAPFLLTQLCLPAMETAGWGRVIYNSSVAGLTGGVVGGHYASSKSALHGLTHWLAGAVAKKGITVNAIAPALVEDTAMLPSGGEELAKSK